MKRYIWSITSDQCIRTREIREYRIEYNTDTNSFYVIAHGYGFGHGVTVFCSSSKAECTAFINELTIPVLRKDGGPGDDV